jgi:N4-(beta-N-acetylglucosaminyl)-L-asparaginase
MNGKRAGLDRREFLRHGVAAGAGTVLLGDKLDRSLLERPTRLERPIIITSHTNDTGRNAMEQAWGVLSGGGSALDAVERGANVIEVDPNDTSVGYGGLPNALGIVELDASVMDGRTYSAGSVASLRNIKTPSSVARLVMERTDHIMLVAEGALQFARDFGFQEEDLMTERSRAAWLRWRENLAPNDDYGPPDHLRGRQGMERPLGGPGDDDFTYGTVNVLAVDANGDVAGITTTSGLSWKVPGRIGDSPIIGAGLYVDNMVGAAGVTGRGEDVIKSCASFFIVMRMRDGRTPQQACEDAADMIVSRYRAVGLDFTPGEKFVAVNKDGEVGCARMGSNSAATMTVRTASGSTTYTGTAVHRPGE